MIAEMNAMVLGGARTPLVPTRLPAPRPGAGQLLVRVAACGVCRTDLHVVDGELTSPKLPLVPGHEIVGTIVEKGGDVIEGFSLGDRVGVPWLGRTCGECRFCRADRENLCERARLTGYDLDGGFADYTIADERFCTVSPCCCTSVGNCESALCTRLLTLTVSMSGLVPSSKLTASVYEPSLPLVLFM